MATATVEPTEGYGLVNEREACQIMGVCRETVREWRDGGELPYIPLGPRLIRYRVEDLIALQKKHLRKGKKST